MVSYPQVCSECHNNRLFLYGWIKGVNMINIVYQLSDEELVRKTG